MAGCPGWDSINPICRAHQVISGVASTVSDGIVGQIASAVQTAEADIIGGLASMWVAAPTPTIGSSSSGDPTGAVLFLWNYTGWLVVLFAIMGLLLAAGKLAWQRRAEPAKAAFSGLFNLVVVTGCSVSVIELATKAGDAFSNWVLYKALAINADPTQPMTSDGASHFNTAVKNIAVIGAASQADMLVIVMGLLGIISCIIQLVLMLVRYAMLGLLTGMLPITASISGTQTGQAAFKKACAWLLAFILYKPVAATIYAYAIVSMKSDNIQTVLAGFAMIIMSVAALPALMRFIVPAVGAASGGGGGAGAALAGAGIASGARMLGEGAKSSGAGGGGGGGGGPEKPDSGKPTGSNKTPTSGAGQGEGGNGGKPAGAENGGEMAGTGAGSTSAGTAGAGTAGAGAAGAGTGAMAAAGPAGIAAAGVKEGIDKAKGAAQGAVQSTTGEGS